MSSGSSESEFEFEDDSSVSSCFAVEEFTFDDDDAEMLIGLTQTRVREIFYQLEENDPKKLTGFRIGAIEDHDRTIIDWGSNWAGP